MTMFPFLFVVFIGAVYKFQHDRITRNSDGKGSRALQRQLRRMQAKCIFIGVLFVWSMFPIVSAIIFQAFAFDESLGDGTAFLKADYSIQRNDPDHQWYMGYAGAVVRFDLIFFYHNLSNY